MEILIKRMSDEVVLPAYAREAGSGINLCAAQDTVIEPGARATVATGVALAIPVGYVGLIVNQYDMVPNGIIRVTPGTIDSGFRHEILIEVHNVGTEPHTFTAGENVAQILVQKVERAQIIEAEDLSDASV